MREILHLSLYWNTWWSWKGPEIGRVFGVPCCSNPDSHSTFYEPSCSCRHLAKSIVSMGGGTKSEVVGVVVMTGACGERIGICWRVGAGARACRSCQTGLGWLGWLGWRAVTGSHSAPVARSASSCSGSPHSLQRSTRVADHGGHLEGGFQESFHSSHTHPLARRPTPGSPERTKVNHIKY